jgi:hypothetical protein
MKVLFLMSSLRAGSHQVRSMLRNEPSISQRDVEHAPLADDELGIINNSPTTGLVPVKYGYGMGLRDCLAADRTAGACALILHRRDWREQAASLAFAARNKAWHGLRGRAAERVAVDWQQARMLKARNDEALEMLTSQLAIPFEVIAYEDISEQTVADALERLLGRSVIVTAPDSDQIHSMDYVLNPEG